MANDVDAIKNLVDGSIDHIPEQHMQIVSMFGSRLTKDEKCKIIRSAQKIALLTECLKGIASISTGEEKFTFGDLTLFIVAHSRRSKELQLHNTGFFEVLKTRTKLDDARSVSYLEYMERSHGTHLLLNFPFIYMLYQVGGTPERVINELEGAIARYQTPIIANILRNDIWRTTAFSPANRHQQLGDFIEEERTKAHDQFEKRMYREYRRSQLGIILAD